MNGIACHPWSLSADRFEKETQGQLESLFCQGNGCLGRRFSAEVPCTGRLRGTYAAGLYDAARGEVGEMVNLPDPLMLRVTADEVELTAESFLSHRAEIDFRTGMAKRDWVMPLPGGGTLTMRVRQFVSLRRLHVMAQRVTLAPDRPCRLCLSALIDGQVTNGGTQHFLDGMRRCVPGDAWQLTCDTAQSGVRVSVAVAADETGLAPLIGMARRRVGTEYTGDAAGEITLTRYVSIRTGRDADTTDPEAQALAEAEEARRLGFDALASESAERWQAYWEKADVRIESTEHEDQTAIRFAMYHLRGMTPLHDSRMNIGAKGLSGEAYKGHVFWDTEMFLLDPWLAVDPSAAKSLMTYRMRTLPDARRKASEMGYRGAMYPWESGWPLDGDLTPTEVEGWIDPKTGKPVPIWERVEEIHISADIALAVKRYVTTTGDKAFMDACGREILRETALFYASRVTWNTERQRYEILSVIGPDEYSEHSDNNAYTNYLAWWNMMLALEEHALEGDEETLVRRVAGKLYLPAPNAEGVIPQADGWLNLKEVDLSGLRGKGLAAFAGMNVQQIGSYQVCKQADVVALLTQFPHSCTRDVLKANLDYYEPRCLHHSSLSYTTHCLAAARLGRTEQAYEFFRQARSVDLNDGATSLEGIHAGAMGGIWQCVVEGFGGVRAENGRVMAVPHLPKEWTKLSFTMSSGGRSYHVIQTQEGTRVTQVQQSGGEKDMQAREKLLRAAGDMLERDGYAALDVTAAAKVSDVPEEVALAYFADKAALCRGVCRDALGRLEQQLTDAIDQMCLEFRMLPELILIGPVRMILEHPAAARLLLNPKSADDTLRSALDGTVRDMNDMIVGHVKLCIRILTVQQPEKAAELRKLDASHLARVLTDRLRTLAEHPENADADKTAVALGQEMLREANL